MENKYLEKISSVASEAGAGLGKVFKHEIVIPGAVIFGADLGAHVAADKLEEHKKRRDALIGKAQGLAQSV